MNSFCLVHYMVALFGVCYKYFKIVFFSCLSVCLSVSDCLSLSVFVCVSLSLSVSLCFSFASKGTHMMTHS